MRRLLWICLITGFFGCKQNKKSNEHVVKEFNINDCFPYQKVDFIKIYFTSDLYKFNNTDSVIVEGKKSINPINDYYFSKTDTKIYDVAYDSVITLIKEKSILRLQSIFRPVRFSFSKSSKCEPIYRDAILFYRQNKIIGAIKICFECEMILFSIEDNRNKYFQDSKQFKTLREYFNKNIHPIK